MNWRSPRLQHGLAQSSPFVFVVVAGIVAFTAYGCVYALRKPFTAGRFEGMYIWGVQYKIALVIAQVAGYALSKFWGIRIVGGLKAYQRAGALLLLSSTAALSLLGFALSPPSWGIVWLFINGIPLGMGWGVVFSYIEGRRATEWLAAMLCINFILSSGAVKSAGKWVVLQGFSEFWMPFLVAAAFFPVLLLCVWLLEHLPPPSERDRAARQERLPMTPLAQRQLFNRYATGLLLLTAVYLVLTILRDLRDNFAIELWTEMGYGQAAGVLTASEWPIALVMLICIGLMARLSDNRLALWVNHLAILTGAVVLFAGTWMFQHQWIGPKVWMMLTGGGIFLGYILFNGIIFDRLLAAFKERGNVGFLMYIADAVGYLGSVATLLWRNFGAPQTHWVAFYSQLCMVGSVLVVVLTAGAWVYFRRVKPETA
jgi:Family of unknown function (DUF5690)